VLLEVLAVGKIKIRGAVSREEEQREKSLEQAMTSLNAQLQKETSEAVVDRAYYRSSVKN